MNQFKQAVEEIGKTFENDDEVENVVLIVARKDGQLHVITDINCPLTVTAIIMQQAAKSIFEKRQARDAEQEGN